MSQKILLVEDDLELGQLIESEIKQNQYEVCWCKSVLQARNEINKNEFDLAIVDLYLPDGKGFELVKGRSYPVIMMSALGDPENRLKGAELGIADFIPKPFLIKELFIKIERFLGAQNLQKKIWKQGAVTLDLNKRQIQSSGEVHLLNKRDYRLLEILSKKYPAVVSRDEIMDYVYGADNNPSQRTIDNAVVGIRQMLNDDDHGWIRSVRGEGYQWQIEESKDGES